MTTSEGLISRAGLAAALEARIIAGELPAGAKLPSERQLAEHYGVSRPIVREALRMLAERNLVAVQPGRGSFVRGVRASDAAGYLDAHYRRAQATPRHLVEARTMLESTSAARAAERATEADLAAIESALTAFDRARDILARARADLAFHLAIARAAANPVIETMFASIAGLTVELMLRSLADSDVTRISVPYHRVIADAIRARDADAARAAMVAHLAVASQLYGADYDRSIESVARRELTRLVEPGLSLADLLAGATGETGEGRDGRTDHHQPADPRGARPLEVVPPRPGAQGR